MASACSVGVLYAYDVTVVGKEPRATYVVGVIIVMMSSHAYLACDETDELPITMQDTRG
jgi:hypothetical protein